MRPDQLVLLCIEDWDPLREDIERVTALLLESTKWEVLRLCNLGGVVPYNNHLPVVAGGPGLRLEQLVTNSLKLLEKLAMPVQPDSNLVSGCCGLEQRCPFLPSAAQRVPCHHQRDGELIVEEPGLEIPVGSADNGGKPHGLAYCEHGKDG
jgi:hypothetical protein